MTRAHNPALDAREREPRVPFPGTRGVPRLGVVVLAARPSNHWGELQGLYEPNRRPPRVTLWMRTASQRRVVAFKTFLRTLLHEVCHHLDYELLGLPDSFHTEGFYKRESSLFHQLVSDAAAEAGLSPGSP